MCAGYYVVLECGHHCDHRVSTKRKFFDFLGCDFFSLFLTLVEMLSWILCNCCFNNFSFIKLIFTSLCCRRGPTGAASRRRQ
jgi:hypothetical protein